MENMAVWVVETTLSDGSKVFAVEINGEKIDCVSEDAANDFAESFVELMEKHTNIEASVFYA